MRSKSLASAGVLWPTVMAVLALAVLIGLGTWQLQRKSWKDGLLVAIAARTQLPAAPLGTLVGPGGPATTPPEYTRVRMQGAFRHAAEQLLWAPDSRLGPGFHVITPFETEGRIVLVNRGFVDTQHQKPERRQDGIVAAPAEIVGLVRASSPRGWFTPDRDTRTGVWYWRDLDGMARSALRTDAEKVLTFIVDAEAPAPGGWPKGGATRLALPNRHLEYALTWYGLAATLVGVWLAFVLPRLKSVRPAPSGQGAG